MEVSIYSFSQAVFPPPIPAQIYFFEAWRSPAEKTQSLLTLRGSSKDGRYVHFLMFNIKP